MKNLRQKRQNSGRGTLRLLISLTLLLAFSSTSLGAVSAQDPRHDPPVVEEALLNQVKQRSDSLDYLIFFEDQADLSAAYGMSWEERGRYVYETLTAQAAESQAQVRQFLDKQGVSYQAFWIQNVISVENSSRAAFNGLLDYWEIDTLTTIPQVFLDEGVVTVTSLETTSERAATSNLAHINVDDAWALGFTGAGIVVGSIDTGVRYTHSALIGQYRGNLGGGSFDHNYSWWDAVNGQAAAYDDHWHGTHTTGTMVGDDGGSNQIGVAPEAAWIACKGFPNAGSGSGTDLYECGQFMLAPWDLAGENANPSLRPHVVNNSWGDCEQTYSNWYAGVIDAWVAAGIYPVFSNGNAGNCGYSYPPGLNTVGNPARSGNVTAVGSTGNSNGAYAAHSNWGPTDNPDTLNPNGYPDLKPQVVAPGVSIRSSVVSGTSDSTYGTATGTSMSAPHVSGLVALIWEAAPCLMGDYADTETLIQQSAVPIPYDTSNGDEGPGNVPNHATGWGEIDALQTVTGTQDLCSVLQGTVTDAGTAQPISDIVVRVLAQGDSRNDRSTTTNEVGFYRIPVNSPEIYNIVVSKFGYYSETIENRAISEDGITETHDFSLTDYPILYFFLPLFIR